MLLRTLTALLLVALTVSARAELIDLDPAGLKSLLEEGVPLVDVRTEKEWKETGVVAGSHLLTFFDERGGYNVQRWMNAFSEIAGKDDPVVLICRSGNRTRQIGTFLDKQAGFRKVYHLKGGIKSWLGSGYAAERP